MESESDENALQIDERNPIQRIQGILLDYSQKRQWNHNDVARLLTDKYHGKIKVNSFSPSQMQASDQNLQSLAMVQM